MSECIIKIKHTLIHWSGSARNAYIFVTKGHFLLSVRRFPRHVFVIERVQVEFVPNVIQGVLHKLCVKFSKMLLKCLYGLDSRLDFQPFSECQGLVKRWVGPRSSLLRGLFCYDSFSDVRRANMRNSVRYWCRKCGDRSYMDMAGIISPLFALAFAFAFAFAPLAALVIIPLRARVISALLRATLLLVKARVAALALDGRELLSVVASLM